MIEVAKKDPECIMDLDFINIYWKNIHAIYLPDPRLSLRIFFSALLQLFSTKQSNLSRERNLFAIFEVRRKCTMGCDRYF